MFIFIPRIPFWVEWFCDVGVFCLGKKKNDDNKVTNATRTVADSREKNRNEHAEIIFVPSFLSPSW